VSKSIDSKSYCIKEIINDTKGLLEDQIVKALSRDSIYLLEKNNPALSLSCKILDISTDQIGYRYDRYEPTSQLINRLIPIESRKKIKIEVTVDNSFEGKTIGPLILEASADFDFANFDTYKDLAFEDLSGNFQSTLSYSLGQLDSYEGAEEAALSRCFHEVALKICDLLQNL
jgi:hypothetical protein